MKLTVLGSGVSSPQSNRTSSGYWLETTVGTILLDCSPSVLARIGAERLDWPNLDAIWVSHFHLDHCGGLAPFLFGIKHAVETLERTKPLKIFGPVGLPQLIDKFDSAANYGLLEQRFPVRVIEVEPLEQIEIFDCVETTFAKTPHTPESLAMHVRDGDDTLVFTADTGPDVSLAALANGVDIFILECSFFRNKPVEKHLELAEAIHLIRRAKPKRAMLTHFYPEWDDVDFETEVKRLEPLCEVIEAKDGLRLEVKTEN